MAVRGWSKRTVAEVKYVRKIHWKFWPSSERRRKVVWICHADRRTGRVIKTVLPRASNALIQQPADKLTRPIQYPHALRGTFCHRRWTDEWTSSVARQRTIPRIRYDPRHMCTSDGNASRRYARSHYALWIRFRGTCIRENRASTKRFQTTTYICAIYAPWFFLRYWRYINHLLTYLLTYLRLRIMRPYVRSNNKIRVS